MVALASLTLNTGNTLRVHAGRVRTSPKGLPRRRLKERTKDEIVALYESGLDSLEVSRRVGVVKSTVLRVLHARGVAVRPSHLGYRRD